MSEGCEKDLKKAAEAVEYELRMLFLTLQALPRLVSESDDIGRKAFLESMLLHARNLIMFLCSRDSGSDRDDITPFDFLTDWEPSAADAVERLEEKRKPINKHLTHLTWTRVRLGPPVWDDSILSDVLAVMDSFVEALREAGHAECFELLDAAVREVRQPSGQRRSFTTAADPMIVWHT